MIAAAPARPSRSRRPGSKKKPSAILSAADRAARLAELRGRRATLFSRVIDYIPCREFLKACAVRLATEPPAAASEPLTRSEPPPAADRGTPYIASLYQTRLLTKDEEQFYFRRMNWLKFKAATLRGRLDPRRASRRQIE
ncbi:MAG: polymerase sigma factor SigA, partial [Planctomycetota bacterium]